MTRNRLACWPAITHRTFVDGCPYKQAQENCFPEALAERSFFRLKETNEHGAPTFIGDTYDGQTWLDILEHRSCSEDCLCRTFSHCNDTALAFSVSKNPDGMTVYIHSIALLKELCGFGFELLPRTRDKLNGLELLQKYPMFKKGLEEHCHTDQSPNPWKTRAINDLTILVDGFLDNPEIFESYGFESLLSNDYLDHDLWKKWEFRNSSINKQLDYLEHAYDTIDDSLQSDLGCEDVQVDQILCSDDTQHQIPKPSQTTSHQSKLSLFISFCTKLPRARTRRRFLSNTVQELRDLEQELDEWDNDSIPFEYHQLASYTAERKSHTRSLIQLHSNFGKEHSRIVQKSQSADLTHRKKWAVRLHHHHRKSWKAGMRALRRLCNGGTPRRLNEVIPFIALTRAMAETSETQTGLLSDFDQNLHSWTTIFQDDDVKRTLFADAVEDIWGIDLHDYVMSPTGDGAIPEQMLERLQRLAKDFVEKANSVFGLDGETCLTGLSAARLRWQQKHPDGCPPAFGEDSAYAKDYVASPLPHWSGNTPFRGNRTLARAETCDGSQERVSLLLLTSVAFACAILFLLMLLVSGCSRQFVTACVDNPISHQRNNSIQTSSENILRAVVSQCFPLGEYVDLSSIKDTSKAALESFAAYRSFVESTISAEHLAIRKTVQDAVLQACDNQQRLIEAETSYGIIKVYLEVLPLFAQEEVPPGLEPSEFSPSSEQTFTLEPVQQNPLQMSSPPSSRANVSSLFDFSGSTSVESSLHLDSANARSTSLPYVRPPHNTQVQSDRQDGSFSEKRKLSPDGDPAPRKRIKSSNRSRWVCEKCQTYFSSSTNMHKHFRSAKHLGYRPSCRTTGCGREFRNMDVRDHHERNEH